MHMVLREKVPGSGMLAWLLRYMWGGQSVSVPPLLGTARLRKKSNLGQGENEAGQANQGVGDRSGGPLYLFMVRDKQSEMEWEN